MNINTVKPLTVPNVLNSVPGLQVYNINSGGFLQMLAGVMNSLNNNISNNNIVETENNFNFSEIPLDNPNDILSYLNYMNIDTKTVDILSNKYPTIVTEKEQEDYKELMENYKIAGYNLVNTHIVYNDNLNYVPKDDINSSIEYMSIPQQERKEYSGSENAIEQNLSSKDNNMKALDKETYASVQAERLVNLINSHKTTLKNEIDFNKATLATNKMPISNNKIITVIDESQEVKSNVINQVKDKIQFMVDDVNSTGTKHVIMELHPLKLGKVEIKMTFENNKLSVEIKSENEETQKILSSNVNELTKILNKSTEAEVNVVVKPNVPHYEFKALYTDNQNEGQGRQKNHYYEQNNDRKDEDEEVDFSELINLRNFKLNAV